MIDVVPPVCSAAEHLVSEMMLVDRDAFAFLVSEIGGLARKVEELTGQVSRLTTKIQRPDRVKYTVDEACARMKLGRTKVYQLMTAGDLSFFEEAGRRRITEEDVVSWERRSRATGSRAAANRAAVHRN